MNVNDLIEILKTKDPNMKVVVNRTRSFLTTDFYDEPLIDSWDDLEDVDEPYETTRETVSLNENKEKIRTRETVLLIGD